MRTFLAAVREEATAFSAAVRRALRAFLCSGRAGAAAVFLALHPCVCRLRPGTGGRHFFGGKGRGGVPFRFTGVSFLPMGRKGLLFPPGVV